MILTAWQIQNLQCYSDISKNEKEKLLPTESYIFLKCNYEIMHSNIFVIFTLWANVWLKKQKMRIPIDVLYNEVRSKYQCLRIILAIFLLEYSILHIKYEILGIVNDKQDLLLDQLNILSLIWHALKIVSVGHFST